DRRVIPADAVGGEGVAFAVIAIAGVIAQKKLVSAVDVQPAVRVKIGLPDAMVVVYVVVERGIRFACISAVIQRHALIKWNALIGLKQRILLNLLKRAIEALRFAGCALSARDTGRSQKG